MRHERGVPWNSGRVLRWPTALLAVLLALALGAGLATCAQPPERAVAMDAGVQYGADEIADLLPGTWLREYTEEGVQVRRLLTLDPRGEFREVSRVTDVSGEVSEFVNEGTWLYDGTNLKRRYTSLGGSPPSRLNVPFVTLAVSFDSRNAFTGLDRIHGRNIHYERVAPETEP